MSTIAATIAGIGPVAPRHPPSERAAVRSFLAVVGDPSALDLETLLREPVNRKARDLVDTFLPRHTTRPLYQYRDLEGFAGILTSGRVWATHSGFLNDPTEVRYCQSILQSAASHIAEHAPGRTGAFLRAYAEEALRDAGRMGAYLTSFTEADDLLSQWMTYTPGASGVAIGFDGAALSELPFVTLRKVVYERRQQFRLLHALLRAYVHPLRNALDADDEERVTTLGVMLGMLLQQCMLCFKDSAFAAEQEWRLIAVPAQGTPFETSVRYRVSGRALVPYVEIPLAPDGGALPVTDVVVGPALDFDLNSVSIGRFLTAHEIAVVPRASKVPFRTVR